MCGTYEWPDVPTLSANKTGLCQFILYQIVRVTLCNTCGGRFAKAVATKYADDVTVCTCGAPFHYFCNPIKMGDEIIEIEDSDKFAASDKYNIACHACSSHLATIKRKQQV